MPRDFIEGLIHAFFVTSTPPSDAVLPEPVLPTRDLRHMALGGWVTTEGAKTLILHG